MTAARRGFGGTFDEFRIIEQLAEQMNTVSGTWYQTIIGLDAYEVKKLNNSCSSRLEAM